MVLIKALVRIKYVHIRETGQPAPDSLCHDVIEDYHRALLGEGEQEKEGDGQNLASDEDADMD